MSDDGRAPDGETPGDPTGPPRLHDDDIAKIAQVVTELLKKNPVSRGDESTSSSSTDRPRGMYMISLARVLGQISKGG